VDPKIQRAAALAIEGVQLWPLTPHRDERGAFTEAFRHEWETGLDPVQWNLLHSQTGTLRGVHVHHQHEDFQVLVSGRATVGLSDLRAGQPRNGVAFEVSEHQLEAVIVPRGVAHGLYFHEPSIVLVGVTCAYDPDDDLGIDYADPDLGIGWPAAPTYLSERDTDAPSLARVLPQLDRYQPFRRPAIE
jgi:dTDP-4-dehydrorhamnose 3,5-epimerase